MASLGSGRTAIYRVVPLLMMVVALGHFNRQGMAVAGAERIVPKLGVSPDRMGLVYSAFLLCYTLAMLPGGWLIDRVGPRKTLMIFCFGSAVFVLLTGSVGLVFHDGASVWLGLLVVRSVMGVFNAPLHPSAARMVFDHVAPQNRSLANGWVTFAACLGIAATYYVFGTLIDVVDWPRAFLVCGSAMLVVSLIWTFGTRTLDAGLHAPFGSQLGVPRAMPTTRGLWQMLSQRGIVCITLSYGALGYFQYVFFYWLEYYFETVQGESVAVARWYSTLVTLAMGIGMVVGGGVADRLPHSLSRRTRRALVPFLGMLGSGLAFEVGVISTHPMVTLAAFALAGALIGACEGSFWTTVVELAGPYGGTAGGLMNTGGNIGGTLSPYATPLLGRLFATYWGEDLGWRLSLAVAGIIVMLGASLWWQAEES